MEPIKKPGEQEPNITLYNNVRNTDVLKKVQLTDFLEGIKKGALSERIAQVRACKDPSLQKEMKGNLPIATISGIFEAGARKAAAITSHSGFIAMDFDGLGTRTGTVKDLLKSDPYTYSVFLSCRGEGLCAIVKIQADPATHRASFDWLANYYKSGYNLEVDSSGSDVCRPRFISYDPDLFLNEASRPIPAQEAPVPAPVPVAPAVTPIPADPVLADALAWVAKGQVDIAPSHNDWLRVGLAFHTTYGIQGLQYFHEACRWSPKYDHRATGALYAGFNNQPPPANPVTVATFIKLCKDKGWRPGILASTLKSPVGAGKPPGKKDPIGADVGGGKYKAPVCKSMLWYILDQHPDWAVNDLNNVLSDGDGKAVTDGAKMDARVEVAGLLKRDHITENIFRDAITQTEMPRFDPVMRLLDNIEKKERDPDALDKLIGVYKYQDDISPVLFKKWIVSFFEGYFKPGASRTALVLTGPQRIGKSSFLLNFLPDALKEFTSTSSLSNENEIGRTFSSNLLVLVDEVDRLPHVDRQKIKNLVSQQIFNFDVKYKAEMQRSQKRCLLAFTTNDEAFLPAGEKNTRHLFVKMAHQDMLPEEIEAMFLKQDLEEAFYQAYLLWKNERYNILTKAEWDEINDQGEDFVFETANGAALQKYFRPAKAGDPGAMFLNTSEVVDRLIKNGVKTKLYITGMGKEMAGAGYKRITLRCLSSRKCTACATSPDPDKTCGSKKKGYWVKWIAGENQGLSPAAPPLADSADSAMGALSPENEAAIESLRPDKSTVAGAVAKQSPIGQEGSKLDSVGGPIIPVKPDRIAGISDEFMKNLGKNGGLGEKPLQTP